MKVQIITNPDRKNEISRFNTSADTTMPNVSTSLNPINREDSTLEAEKDEVVVSPDLATIHKILGKPHSKGGTPLNLEEGSFIFSKDKSLAISKNEQKVFNFKMGGSVKKEDNTPAKILLRQIDIKHHNQMNAILNNKANRDFISKNTAEIMLDKNAEKIGQIAYLQEAKKDFKSGIPAFSEGTQPIYSQAVKDKIVTEDQYMKYGGSLKKYAKAGFYNNPPDNGKLEAFRGKQSNYGNLQYLNPFLENANRFFNPVPGGVGPVNPTINTIGEYQNKLSETYPELIDYVFKNNSNIFGATNKAYSDELRKKYNIPSNISKDKVLDYMYTKPESEYKNFIQDQFKDNQWGQRALNLNTINFDTKEEYDNAIKDKVAVGTKQGTTFYQDPNDKRNFINYTYKTPIAIAPLSTAVAKTEVKADGTPIVPNPFVSTGQYTNQKVPFNTGQIASLVGSTLINGMRKNIYPTRTENTFIPLELEKVNANTAIQANTNNWLQGARVAATMGTSPSQSNAFLQRAVIEGIAGENKIRDQYDTSNVQIGNQQNEYNNKGFNQVRAQNVNNNQQYVKESDLLKGRINQEKITNATNFLNTGLGYYGENLQMQNALNTMQQYGVVDANGNPVIDPKTGKQKFNTAYSTDFNGNFKFNNVSGMNATFNFANTSTPALQKRINELDEEIKKESDRNAKSRLIQSRTALETILYRQSNKKYGGYIKRK